MRVDKKIFFIMLGSAFEYYDFVLYGLLATQISKAFFPALDSKVQLIQSLSIFALGYIVRPLSGTILGIIADRYSKVKVFAFSMLLMGISTLFIGLLPSYETIGMAASFLLILARITQGISFASEIPGAVTILSEAYLKKLPNFIGYLMSATNFGFILASALIYFIHLLLTEEQILSWGWRIPFIIGGVLAFISYYVRRDLSALPELQKIHTNFNKKSLKAFFSEVLLSNSISIFQGIGITSVIASGTMFFIYLPHFLEEYYILSSQDIRLFFFIGLITFIIFCLIFGNSLKHFNIAIFFIVSLLTFPIIIYFLLFQLSLIGGKLSLFFLFVFYEIYMAAFFTSGLILLSKLFPLHLRNTCISWCYNFSFSIFSLMPATVTYLIMKTQRIEIISLLFFIIFFISLTFLFSNKVNIFKLKFNE